MSAFLDRSPADVAIPPRIGLLVEEVGVCLPLRFEGAGCAIPVELSLRRWLPTICCAGIGGGTGKGGDGGGGVGIGADACAGAGGFDRDFAGGGVGRGCGVVGGARRSRNGL